MDKERCLSTLEPRQDGDRDILAPVRFKRLVYWIQISIKVFPCESLVNFVHHELLSNVTLLNFIVFKDWPNTSWYVILMILHLEEIWVRVTVIIIEDLIECFVACLLTFTHVTFSVKTIIVSVSVGAIWIGRIRASGIL